MTELLEYIVIKWESNLLLPILTIQYITYPIRPLFVVHRYIPLAEYQFTSQKSECESRLTGAPCWFFSSRWGTLINFISVSSKNFLLGTLRMRTQERKSSCLIYLLLIFLHLSYSFLIQFLFFTDLMMGSKSLTTHNWDHINKIAIHRLENESGSTGMELSEFKRKLIDQISYQAGSYYMQ